MVGVLISSVGVPSLQGDSVGEGKSQQHTHHGVWEGEWGVGCDGEWGAVWSGVCGVEWGVQCDGEWGAVWSGVCSVIGSGMRCGEVICSI